MEENENQKGSSEKIGGIPIFDIERYRLGGGSFRISDIQHYFGTGPNTTSSIQDYLLNAAQKKAVDAQPSTKEEETGNAPEVISIPIGKVELHVSEILKAKDGVKSIGHLKIDSGPSENELTLTTRITVRSWGIKSEINLLAVLINEGNNIKLQEGYQLSATKGEEKVKELFAQKIGSIGAEIKEYIEKTEGKKVEKIEIENGELKVTFKPVPGPFSDEEDLATIKAEVEKSKKAEAIERLKETIASAQRTLEENKTQKEALLKELEEIKKETTQVPNPGEDEMLEREKQERGEERKEAERQAQAEALERDKTQNPFKYFLIKNMDDRVFSLLFSKIKEDISVEDLNKQMGQSGKEIKVLNFLKITKWKVNIVHITSNGFSLQLQNVEEVQGEKGILINDPRAKYKIINSSWTYTNDGELNYKDGVQLLQQKAQEYQAQQLALFEKETKSKEQEPQPPVEAEREIFEL